jgi:Fe2+ or Zn2+ uptake regulation protein
MTEQPDLTPSQRQLLKAFTEHPEYFSVETSLEELKAMADISEVKWTSQQTLDFMKGNVE